MGSCFWRHSLRSCWVRRSFSCLRWLLHHCLLSHRQSWPVRWSLKCYRWKYFCIGHRFHYFLTHLPYFRGICCQGHTAHFHHYCVFRVVAFRNKYVIQRIGQDVSLWDDSQLNEAPKFTSSSCLLTATSPWFAAVLTLFFWSLYVHWVRYFPLVTSGAICDKDLGHMSFSWSHLCTRDPQKPWFVHTWPLLNCNIFHIVSRLVLSALFNVCSTLLTYHWLRRLHQAIKHRCYQLVPPSTKHTIRTVVGKDVLFIKLQDFSVCFSPEGFCCVVLTILMRYEI